MVLAAALALVAALAQEFADPREEARRQKQLLLETAGILPTELIVEEGRDLFYRRGPSGKTMEACDFGLGPGVLEGAAARLPRYFLDTNRVEDLDSRILTCMTRVQGFRPEQVRRSEVVALAFYIASYSTGKPIQVRLLFPQERELYALGERLFYARSGARDMGCATCHVTYVGRRAGVLPYADVLGKDKSWTNWPAYRYSNDQAWTMQDRIRACYTVIGHPGPELYSLPILALQLFMAYHANGVVVEEWPAFVR
ncbi:sulfur oxidation c-type cytochrome SoxA [Thermus thermamylovorans]|uniref:SoxAX cytochrome complex subunit A n=1 Tax=Thermus thermamylovorans TaxID=2509362 RepID=A0A4Q9AZI3_9DEIN|nr:sulfur oxidation c-type cytochrome SoxA [Thermus thermamylovorans]TBH17265.1 sulfur oxidation c-type cytochrome SoxA [Thermus thermamylovorans]